MKSPTLIRTAEVLAVWDAVPAVELRQAERISGHLDFLKRVGKIERVSRGVYRRTAFGGRAA
jgi:hypothetical protein